MTSFDVLFTATALEPMHRPDDSLWVKEGFLQVNNVYLRRRTDSVPEVEDLFDPFANTSDEEQRFSELNRYEYGLGPLTQLIREYLTEFDDEIYLIRMHWDGGFMRGTAFIDVSKKFRDMETIAIDVNPDSVPSVPESCNGRLLDLELYTIYKFIDGSRIDNIKKPGADPMNKCSNQ